MSFNHLIYWCSVPNCPLKTEKTSFQYYTDGNKRKYCLVEDVFLNNCCFLGRGKAWVICLILHLLGLVKLSTWEQVQVPLVRSHNPNRRVMHQSIPAALSLAPATAGRQLDNSRMGHLQILRCPRAGHLPTPGLLPRLWHARGFLSEYNYTKGYYWKKADWLICQGQGVVKACFRFYVCISPLLIKPELHSESWKLSTWINVFCLVNQISVRLRAASLFFSDFVWGVHARERWAAKPRDARNEGGNQKNTRPWKTILSGFEGSLSFVVPLPSRAFSHARGHLRVSGVLLDGQRKKRDCSYSKFLFIFFEEHPFIFIKLSLTYNLTAP